MTANGQKVSVALRSMVKALSATLEANPHGLDYRQVDVAAVEHHLVVAAADGEGCALTVYHPDTPGDELGLWRSYAEIDEPALLNDADDEYWSDEAYLRSAPAWLDVVGWPGTVPGTRTPTRDRGPFPEEQT